MSADDNRELMRRYLIEVLAEGSLEVLSEIADEAMVDEVARASGLRPGRDGWVDHVNHFRAALPDVEITVDRIVADDDGVVGLWTASGTHSGPFLGVAPTGRRITGTAASFFKVRNGKVTEYRVLVDQHPLLQQMTTP